MIKSALYYFKKHFNESLGPVLIGIGLYLLFEGPIDYYPAFLNSKFFIYGIILAGFLFVPKSYRALKNSDEYAK